MAESDAPKGLSWSDVEATVDSFAKTYAKEHYNLPHHAVTVLMWPAKEPMVKISHGPSAIIRLFGLGPSIDPKRNKSFQLALKNAIDFIYRHKMWESMSLEPAVAVTKRERDMKRYRWERYKFREELVPNSLNDADIIVHKFTRVEVVHRDSKLREVVEVEEGKGFTHTAVEVARDRLSRRVHEEKMKSSIETLGSLPVDDPNWVAITN